MDTFHQDSSICRNKALVALWTKLGWRALFTPMLFNSLSLRLLNLWPALIKYEINIQISETEVLKLFCDVWNMAKQEWQTAVSLVRRKQQEVPITVPLEQPAGQWATARAVSCEEKTLNNTERAELLWWGHRGRVLVTKNLNLWEVSLH